MDEAGEDPGEEPDVGAAESKEVEKESEDGGADSKSKSKRFEQV